RRPRRRACRLPRPRAALRRTCRRGWPARAARSGGIILSHRLCRRATHATRGGRVPIPMTVHAGADSRPRTMLLLTLQILIGVELYRSRAIDVFDRAAEQELTP